MTARATAGRPSVIDCINIGLQDIGRQLHQMLQGNGKTNNYSGWLPMAFQRFAALAALNILVLSACGGGGGGGEAISAAPEASVSIATRSVTVSATYADYAPSRSITVTAANVPDTGLYVGVDAGTAGLAYADLQAASETTANLVLQFRSPIDVDVGTVTDQVTVYVCLDDQCDRQVRGSPMTVTASYTVSAPMTAALASPTMAATGALQDMSAPQGSTAINLTHTGAIAPSVLIDTAYSSIDYVSAIPNSPISMQVTVNFRHPANMGVGSYTENVALRVCYDSACRREVSGSPLALQTSYVVSSVVPPEPNITTLPYLTRTTLSHDVVDAEYSASLDAIVMVSAKPTSSLYVYDTATGTESEVRLNRVPTAVGVSPDGNTAAVGHDALITIVDLTTAGQAGAPAPVVLNLSADAFDVVLDGHGFVHAVPRVDQWVEMHSVEIATNTESLGTGILRAGSRVKLHPSGESLYTADNGLSPSDIAKFDIRSGIAAGLYDSPYHGDYEMCGDLWLKQDGAVIYTKCGNTFRTSTIRNDDMVYNGRLQLSVSQSYGYQIDSLSQSDATDEIALLEADWYSCTVANYDCYTHLNLYESEFLNRTAVYSLAPIDFNGSTYSQRGSFVFHSADGAHRYIISHLFRFPGTDEPYYLTVQQ
jgi:hypothetical protein